MNSRLSLQDLEPFTPSSTEGDVDAGPVSIQLDPPRATRLYLLRFADDPHPEAYLAAINSFNENFLRIKKEATPFIRMYRRDYGGLEDNWDDIWATIEMPGELAFSRRPNGDRAIYVYVVCECPWEPEHGLSIVIRSGNELVSVGPFSSHFDNAVRFGDPSLEDVIYVSR